MPATKLDLRETPPKDRHPKIHAAFDADRYDCERIEKDKYVSDLPKHA